MMDEGYDGGDVDDMYKYFSSPARGHVLRHASYQDVNSRQYTLHSYHLSISYELGAEIAHVCPLLKAYDNIPQITRDRTVYLTYLEFCHVFPRPGRTAIPATTYTAPSTYLRPNLLK